MHGFPWDIATQGGGDRGGGMLPPSHLSVLKLASLALPISPSPYGDTPTVHCIGLFYISSRSSSLHPERSDLRKLKTRLLHHLP
jgi:hypothetical protein